MELQFYVCRLNTFVWLIWYHNDEKVKRFFPRLPSHLEHKYIICNGKEQCTLNIYEMFDALCLTEQVNKGKEYSDIFLFTAKCLGISPQNCLVFEDVLPAVKSAKQAGMIVCGVYDKRSAHQKQQNMDMADNYLYSFENAPLPRI